jgi:uncharacterized damage-inducible protein DinB
VAPPDPKADLHSYLRDVRQAVLWKLEGLSEYDVRRPLVPTGTNLLGLVKHLATVEWGHFGAAFDRPFGESLPWVDDSEVEPNADKWATPEESRDWIVDLYRRIAAHSDTVIDALPLDAIGHVPWWPSEFREVTLQHILLHTVAESHRHAGHADILRELIDGSAGLSDGGEMLPDGDEAWWQRHRKRLEQAARQVGSGLEDQLPSEPE